jgi:hypothetical protein
MRQKKKTTNKKVSKKEIISETISEVIEEITYSFAKLKDGTVKFDKKGKLDKSYYKTFNELLKAKEKETIKNDGYDQVRKSLLLWQILANHFEVDPEGEYFEDIKEVYKKSPYSNYKNILENPIFLKKITFTITSDLLDEELKGIENIDKQIECLEKLKTSSERILTEKKKETIILSKSFLKTVIEKDNFDFIDINNLESLLKDEHFIDTIYYQLIKHEKLLINSNDIHLLETFYSKQNRENKKPKNEKDFKPAITPFSHIRVDIIEKEINLINLYLRVREGFREYLKNNDLNNDKYCFDYDIPLVIMFSRLLKSTSEKKFYLNKILKRTKKEEDFDKINSELDYLELNLKKTDENTKNKIEKIFVLISKLQFLKGFKLFVNPPQELNIPPYIDFENKNEIITELVANHFYFVNEDNEIDKFTKYNEKIDWITENQIPFYWFLDSCEHFKIFSDEQQYRNDELYSKHFSYNKNNLNPKNISSRKSKIQAVAFKSGHYKIKDILVRSVINIFLEEHQ